MSKQLSFTDLEQTTKKKQTRREIFLAEMDKVMPWDKLEATIDPFYRLCCINQWRGRWSRMTA